MRTLGRYLVQALESAGVRHVFGIPGMHNLELYRGLHGASLRHVTGRHEQGLGFMADGYARVSGRPGVCFTISGPGVSNIATAIGQAYGDSIPILVIASQNRPGEAGSGRGFLHELLDQRGLAAALTGASYAIADPDELPGALTQAFSLFAAARPRPVYIEIPLNLLAADAAALALPGRPAKAPTADPIALTAAAQQLRAAARPVVLAGGGAVRAATELRQLVELLGAPLVMTSNGRGLLPPEHPLAVPMSPSLAPVRALIAGADLVLAVGTEIGPTDFDMYGLSEFPPPPNLIRIDIDAAQLRRNAPARLGLQGDSAATLRALLRLDLETPRPQRGEAAAAAARTGALATLAPAMRTQLQLLELIRDALPRALLVGDSTQMVYAGLLAFAAATPGSWFNSATGYGTLGYALPASTGAGLAAPDRPVVCLVGDGGLQFSLGELAVLREVDAWTAIIIWNNRGFGEIRSAMLAAQIQPEGVDVQPPDFALLAAAYGYRHQLIETADALELALREFASRRQVLVLELASD
ncbi:MAG TPA: 5-guanidino-2-oxopentanoate decarboxylase [Steroidobacteraceae bacterium]|jgi:acetolactate synthase-1/2/3 large subunit